MNVDVRTAQILGLATKESKEIKDLTGKCPDPNCCISIKESDDQTRRRENTDHSEEFWFKFYSDRLEETLFRCFASHFGNIEDVANGCLLEAADCAHQIASRYRESRGFLRAVWEWFGFDASDYTRLIEKLDANEWLKKEYLTVDNTKSVVRTERF